jgi:hypothetical protein
MEVPRLNELLVSRFRIKPPLVKPSKLASRDVGGVGKNLSDGWAVNFVIGCYFACPFCYVDSIWKRYGRSRFSPAVKLRWGELSSFTPHRSSFIRNEDRDAAGQRELKLLITSHIIICVMRRGHGGVRRARTSVFTYAPPMKHDILRAPKTAS